MNVKQGDCLILRPEHCCYKGEAFIVDTGNGQYDFTQSLTDKEPYYLMLTHAHTDHINGVNFLLTSKKLNYMMSLILPYYHNECVLMAKALLSLKGMKNMNDKWRVKDQLNQIIMNQKLLLNWEEQQAKEKTVDEQKELIRFVKEGDWLCDHIQILNPPYSYQDCLSKLSEKEIEELAEPFEREFSEHLQIFLRLSQNNAAYVIDAPNVNSLSLGKRFSVSSFERGNFITDFLKENRERFIDFNEHPTESKLLKLIENKELKEHQSCMVFRYCHGEDTFLFGGDADISVWERLIQSGKDISAVYLKVPHHGSKKNLNEKILKAIHPKVAIISHGNRKFGNAKDPHPNREVLKLLEKNSVKIISTNDIIKSDLRIWDCSRQNCYDENVEVVTLL